MAEDKTWTQTLWCCKWPPCLALLHAVSLLLLGSCRKCPECWPLHFSRVFGQVFVSILSCILVLSCDLFFTSTSNRHRTDLSQSVMLRVSPIRPGSGASSRASLLRGCCRHLVRWLRDARSFVPLDPNNSATSRVMRWKISPFTFFSCR